MNVYTVSEATNLPLLLERASVYGEIQLKYREGELFALKPIQSTHSPSITKEAYLADRTSVTQKPLQPPRSPLDIVGVNLNLSTAEIVDVIREMRERHY